MDQQKTRGKKEREKKIELIKLIGLFTENGGINGILFYLAYPECIINYGFKRFNIKEQKINNVINISIINIP